MGSFASCCIFFYFVPLIKILQSPSAHWKEKMNLYLYVGQNYFCLSWIKLVRALLPLFWMFERDWLGLGIGFGFRAVRIFVTYEEENTEEKTEIKYLTGEMAKQRHKKHSSSSEFIITRDIGAGGAVSIGEDAETSCQKECKEELGLTIDTSRLKKIKTLTPFSGFHCLVDHYHYPCSKEEYEQIERIKEGQEKIGDGTFTRLEWNSLGQILEQGLQFKEDPLLGLMMFNRAISGNQQG